MNLRAGRGGGRQVRLGDLVLAVIGSAFVFDVARRSREGWIQDRPNQAQSLGLVVLTLAVGLGEILVGQGVRRLRDRGASGRGWPVGWRLVALAGLCWLASEVSEVVRTPQAELQNFGPINTTKALMRLDAMPLMASLGLVGLVLALTPLGRRSASAHLKPGWSPRLGVVLAVLAGVMVVASWQGIYGYFVLFAIEAVDIALWRAPRISRPLVVDRLQMAGLEALPGLAGCLLSALWIDEDLRAGASGEVSAREPRSTMGWVGRVSTVTLAVAGSGYVLLRSIPRLSPHLAEGVATAFELSTVSTVSTVVVGFACLAAGISSRSASRLVEAEGSSALDEPGSRLGPWPRRVLAALVGLFAVIMIISAVRLILGEEQDRWYSPINLATWSSGSRGFAMISYSPSGPVIMLSSIWIACLLIAPFLGQGGDRTAPLDRIALDRRALGRFLSGWIGLWILMLASLPILSVVALAVTHHLVVWFAN